MNLTPWKVKKLDDDSFAYLVPDAEIRADAGKMAVKVVVSTETMDRERDILIAKGCDTSDHKRNPIVLLNHRRDWPGIASSQDPAGNYTVKIFDDHIEATNYFNQATKLGLQSFRLVESGALRGVSPGFMTVPGAVHKIKASDGHPAFIYNAWKLAEITHCPIGMNPDALVLAVEKGFGGESLTPELKDLLIPYLPARKAMATSGFTAKGFMDEEREDATNGNGNGGGADSFAPSNGNGNGAPVADESMESPDVDEQALTPSSQLYQSVIEMTTKLLGMVMQLQQIQEGDRTKSDCHRIVSLIGGIKTICEKGIAKHVADFPDQPSAPGGDFDPPIMAEWRQKAVSDWYAYLESWQKAVSEEDVAVIKKAVTLLRAQSKDMQLPGYLRTKAYRMAQELSHVRMVEAPTAEQEAKELENLKSALLGMKSDLTTLASTRLQLVS